MHILRKRNSSWVWNWQKRSERDESEIEPFCKSCKPFKSEPGFLAYFLTTRHFCQILHNQERAREIRIWKDSFCQSCYFMQNVYLAVPKNIRIRDMAFDFINAAFWGTIYTSCSFWVQEKLPSNCRIHFTISSPLQIFCHLNATIATLSKKWH